MTQADSVHSTPPVSTFAIDEQPSTWLRHAAEAEIERLLAFLDQLDGDADLESAGDELEPDLGSVAGRREFDQSTWSAGADGEPSLGSIEDHPNGYRDGSDDGDYGRNQARWASGNGDDCEGDEHDGREPDDNEGGDGAEEDCEPSLGWTNGMVQGQGRLGGSDDRELAAEPSRRCVETSRKRHTRNSICNVTMLDGSAVTVL
jgi:hypothetical protein